MCKYHIIFTSKYRRKIIYNQLKVDIYEKIEEAEIWIPYHEIEKKFLGSRMSRINKLQEQIFKEERSISKDATHIEPLE